MEIYIYIYNMDAEEELDEIEELIDWNISFGIPIRDTLIGIDRLDLLDYFKTLFSPIPEPN